MTRILTIYLAREILKTSSATMLILYVILLSNSFGRVLADIADGDIPQRALWPVLLGQSVNLLSLLLPIALFLGIVFTFGRMYKDHEIVVMNACGIGYRDFYRPVFIVLIPFMALSIYSSLWLNAQVLKSAQDAVDRESNLHEFQQIKPGQFNQSGSGNLVFFMDSVSEDNLELRDIIISQTDREAMVIETGESGKQTIDERSGDLFLIIGPGERYEGQPGDNRIKHITFDQHGILIEKKVKQERATPRSDQMTPKQLWKSKRHRNRIEFHWRVAVPVVLLVLALLAVPLAYIAPRQGRYGKVGAALLVFIVYLNLMAFTRAQLEDRVIPVELNFWWVHLLFVLLTLATYLPTQSRRHSLAGERMIVNRYIQRNIHLGTVGALLLLVSLALFFVFVRELDDVGKGAYGISQVLQFLALSIPGKIVEFLPLAVLLGSMLSLGALANNSELIAMQGIGHYLAASAGLRAAGRAGGGRDRISVGRLGRARQRSQCAQDQKHAATAVDHARYPTGTLDKG